jgi:hypothetical protein
MFKSIRNFFGNICMSFSMFVTSASAIDLDEATRTVVKDSSGTTVVLSPEIVVGNDYLMQPAGATTQLSKTPPNPPACVPQTV